MIPANHYVPEGGLDTACGRGAPITARKTGNLESVTCGRCLKVVEARRAARPNRARRGRQAAASIHDYVLHAEAMGADHGAQIGADEGLTVDLEEGRQIALHLGTPRSPARDAAVAHAALMIADRCLSGVRAVERYQAAFYGAYIAAYRAELRARRSRSDRLADAIDLRSNFPSDASVLVSDDGRATAVPAGGTGPASGACA